MKKYSFHRGFLKRYSTNLLTVSNLAYVSISYCSSLFDTNLYRPLLTYSNSFLNIVSKKKTSILNKWISFKRGVKDYLAKIINNKKIKKHLKFYLFYKSYKVLKNSLKRKITILYRYFSF